MKTLFIIGALLVNLSLATVSYENDQIWRIFASSERKPEVEALIDQYFLDVWASQPHHIDALITSEISSLIGPHLEQLGFSHEVLIENIQQMINDQEEIRDSRKEEIQPSTNINTAVYHRLGQINKYIKKLVRDYDWITVETVGQSIEGRDLNVVKLSTKANNADAFWIQCGIHAREWVSPASCVYGLDYLTQNYGSDDSVTKFLDSHDVYMVVVVNPDGYKWSWRKDRLWRKNRRTWEETACVGVDLNRNYDDGTNFGGPGSSNMKCNTAYHGEYGFSEPETSALRDKLYEIQKTQNVISYYDVHSYGLLWLSSYGWTYNKPPTYDEQMRVSAAAVNAIAAIEGTIYTYGPISEVIYLASGGAIDWSYAYGVEYSYTPELRDSGRSGFLLPEDQIEITAIELWAAIFAADAAIAETRMQ